MAWEINRAAFKRLVSAGVGGWGGGGGLPPPPPSTHRKYPVAMYNFCGILFVSVERWHCVYMGASAATNTTGRQLRQIKILWQWVSCAEQRWWTFMFKKWFGLGLAVSVPDNEAVKNSGLAGLGSDRVGLGPDRAEWGRVEPSEAEWGRVGLSGVGRAECSRVGPGSAEWG